MKEEDKEKDEEHEVEEMEELLPSMKQQGTHHLPREWRCAHNHLKEHIIGDPS